MKIFKIVDGNQKLLSTNDWFIEILQNHALYSSICVVGGGWEEEPTGLNFKKRTEFPAIY